MFRAAYPLFEKGRLLKTEMLEALRDYPRELAGIWLKDYKNGLLRGCEIGIREHYLMIRPGILHFDGILYVLKEDYELPYQSNNRLTLLKVNCLGRNQEKDFVRGISRIYLDFEPDCREDEIELCRFQLREGAGLRNEYTGFRDMSTQYDTVNRTHVPYLGEMGYAPVPELLLQFAKEALLAPRLEAEDMMFSYLILQNGGRMEAGAIGEYLRRKGISPGEPEGVYGYYEGLLRVLEHLLEGRSMDGPDMGRNNGILLV